MVAGIAQPMPPKDEASETRQPYPQEEVIRILAHLEEQRVIIATICNKVGFTLKLEEPQVKDEDEPGKQLQLRSDLIMWLEDIAGKVIHNNDAIREIIDRLDV